VFEVDHLYYNAANACLCKPETFQVVLQDATGKSVTAVPKTLDTCQPEPDRPRTRRSARR